MFKTVEALHDNITNEGFYPLTHEQAVIDNNEVDLETKLNKINKDIYSKVTDYSKQYLTTVALEQGTISFNIWKNMGTDMITSISYSIDEGKTWTKTNNVDDKEAHIQINVNVNTGDSLLWKGEAQQLGFHDPDDGDVGSFFSSTASFNVLGNVMSMCYGDDFENEDKLEYAGQFCWLFSDYDNVLECKVVDASRLSLPATTLAERCYQYMFNGCTSLTTAPELHANILANCCYGGMFQSCTSLAIAPQLPATTLATKCYVSMLYGCTALTTAPELPATSLASYCYNLMFYNCTSLTTAPELPATTLAERCYSDMFGNCTSLTTAPELPATTLAEHCYQYMFSDCTHLNYIKCLATNISASNCTTNWVYGVAATGTFIKADSMSSWTTGNNGIPTNWNVYTESEYEVVRHYELATVATSGNYNDLLNKPALTEIKQLYYNATTGLLATSNYSLTFTDSLDGYDMVKCYFRPTNKNLSDSNIIPPAVLYIMLNNESKLLSGEYTGSVSIPYIDNDNRYAAYRCIISADKTQFRVISQTSLYGTAGTNISNASHGIYCYKIEAVKN